MSGAFIHVSFDLEIDDTRPTPYHAYMLQQNMQLQESAGLPYSNQMLKPVMTSLYIEQLPPGLIHCALDSSCPNPGKGSLKKRTPQSPTNSIPPLP